MDILQLLDDLRIPRRIAGQHEHVTRRYVGIDCPRCSPGSGRFRLGIHLERLHCNCWSCGGMPVWLALAEASGLPSGRIVEMLGGMDRIRLNGREGKPRGKLKLPSGLGPLGSPHRKYLKSRGFDPDEIVRLWDVMATGTDARLPWRLWLPIKAGGETVSWTSRSIGTAEPKYMSASADEEAVPHRSILYGADYVRGSCVLVEGPLDAWRIGPGAVAGFGLSLTRDQLAWVSGVPVRAVCLDAEPAARRRQRRVLAALSSMPGETHGVELRTGKDPAEADLREVGEIRKRFLEG